MPHAAATPTACPCGLPAPYAQCCGRWHAGPLHLQAPSAEALMRSRYSAYALGLSDYLRDTWHPRTRPNAVELEQPGPRWLGLEVRGQRALPDAQGERSEPVAQAEVEFVARCKQGGRATRLHETSRFLRENGHWFYLDGVLR